MGYRLVDTGWDRELAKAMEADSKRVRIVCHFIKISVVEKLLKTAQQGTVQVITRFNLSDFAEGVSDICALRYLLERGAQVRGVRNLHAKLYLFGASRAIVTSANLTNAGLRRNHELGFVAEDADIVTQCSNYFTDLWSRAGNNLTWKRIDGWDKKVTRYLATGGVAVRPGGLCDEGVDAGIATEDLVVTPWLEDAPQAFVKFLGEGINRKSLSYSTLDEVKRAGCHWAVAYPKSKRPTGVKEGALIFIGRLTKEPNDIRIFGRAIGMRYEPGRDDATSADIALRPWKTSWSRYVRVHHSEFLSGSLANGVSLNELMETLKAQSFASTQRNFKKGSGNIDPRKAYQRQAAVELTPQGLAWLNSRLEESFAMHGKLKLADSGELDWPKLPAR